MPAKDVLDKINLGPFGSQVTNFSAVNKKGISAADAVGKKDFTNPDSQQSSGATMFGEGSVGKVRYAGLAYMLQQEGTMDLTQNARKFFADEKTGKFLEKKYPGQGAAMQGEIANLFSGDSAKATLSDLTTHRSGVGDITRDQSKLFAQKGVEHPYSAADLLLVERDPALVGTNGKPKVQTAPHLPDAKYGEHQYSNLNYLLLGLAMEASYDAQKNPTGEKEIKDYKQLTNDYMLHPVEGPAKDKGLSFNQTKFSNELTADDNVAKASWLEGDHFADATQFSGANSAGGMFASADDSTKFFGEYFKGFPGMPQAAPNSNPFFSDETIAQMVAEGKKFGNCGINGGGQDASRKGNEHFQMPGAVFEEDKNGNVISYEKGGGTFGYASFLNVTAANGASIDMCAQENATGEMAKNSGITTEAMIDKYRSDSGEYDRAKMLESEMPQLEISQAVEDVVAALHDNDASALDDATSPKNLANKSPETEGRQQ